MNSNYMPLIKTVFDSTEIENIQKCLESGWVTQGPLTKDFEDIIAERHKVKHALAVSSCTAALHLAVIALGIGPGDEVIVPAFTWVTSANCAEYTGAKAVFADVELDTFNLDPDAFEAAITPRTKAVIVVHLFGLSAKMDEIMAIAKKHSIKVIEDAACAIGTEYNGTPVGGIGDIGCFSFHPRKVITTGEGGMLTTNDDNTALMLSSLRSHGAEMGKGAAENKRPSDMGEFPNLGFNYRLSDIQAAVGIAQTQKLDGILAERKQLALQYSELLNGNKNIAIPYQPDKCGHTYQSYVIRLTGDVANNRNRIMDTMESCGIQTRPGTHAPYRLAYYREKYGLAPNLCPVAAACEDTSITLPVYHNMKFDEQKIIAKTLLDALNGK